MTTQTTSSCSCRDGDGDGGRKRVKKWFDVDETQVPRTLGAFVVGTQPTRSQRQVFNRGRSSLIRALQNNTGSTASRKAPSHNTGGFSSKAKKDGKRKKKISRTKAQHTPRAHISRPALETSQVDQPEAERIAYHLIDYSKEGVRGEQEVRWDAANGEWTRSFFFGAAAAQRHFPPFPRWAFQPRGEARDAPQRNGPRALSL